MLMCEQVGDNVLLQNTKNFLVKEASMSRVGKAHMRLPRELAKADIM